MHERLAYLRDGAAIYQRSFAIIRAEADLARFSLDWLTEGGREEAPRLPGTAPLGLGFLGVTDAGPNGNVTGTPEGVAIPRRPTAYLLPFEIVSVHLLVVLVGAAYLARAKRKPVVGGAP